MQRKQAWDSAGMNLSLRPGFLRHCTNYCGRDNVVSITTVYGVHGTEFESLWGGARIFLPIQTPPSVLKTEYRVPFPVVQRQGCGADYQPPYNAEVKE